MEVSGQLHAPAALIPDKEPPNTYCTHRTQVGMGPTTGLERREEEKNFRYYREPNFGGSLYRITKHGCNVLCLTSFRNLWTFLHFSRVSYTPLLWPGLCFCACLKNAIPVTCHGGPSGCGTSRLPHFLQKRLTALRADRALPPGRFLILFC
jgi:hypothetical protein